MSQLQTEMHDKRREAYELEDKLGVNSPAVFATVQVGSGADRQLHDILVQPGASRQRCHWSFTLHSHSQEALEQPYTRYKCFCVQKELP